MTKSEIIAKIQKCLALSKSSNAYEAAAALRQARKLMEAHGISDPDILAAEVDESMAKAGALNRPARWETALASKIGDAFACEVLFRAGLGKWCFIGAGIAPEIARYAFEVLIRQAKRSRSEYIKTKLARCKGATKTRRADLYSEGWVRAAGGTVDAFSGANKPATAIAAYMAKNYPTARDLTPQNRNAGRGLSDRALADYRHGRHAGKDARLHHGVAGAEQRLIGG